MRKAKSPNEIIVKGDVAEIWIPRKGKKECCLVDTEDLPRITHLYVTHTGYIRIIKDKKGILFHRYIMNIPQNNYLQIDHINRNPLDNRKENLRLVSNQENQRNTSLRKDSTSGIKGVSYRNIYRNHAPGWIAHIRGLNGKNIKKSFSLSVHPNAIELAIAQRRAWEIEFGYTILPNNLNDN